MLNFKRKNIFKTSATVVALLVLSACGGANNGTNSSANDSTNNTAVDFPLYSAEGLTNGSSALELTPEQLANATQSLQAFEQNSQTQTNVNGFIVKYKNDDNSVVEASDIVGTTATVTSSGAGNINATNVVSSLGAVTEKHGVDLTFKAQNFTGAAVLNSNQNLTLSKAKEIAAEMKAADSKIDYVEPNILMTSTALPTSIELSSLWALKTASAYGMNAQQTWSTADGNKVVVAVVDTGYRPHVDLAGQFVMNGSVVAGYDFIGDTTVSGDGNGRDNNPIDPGDSCNGSPSSWHGTHVAGTIAAASNGSGIAGVAYGAKILPVRVLGKCGGYLSDVADGIVWAAGGTVSGVPQNLNPAKVINLSLGGASSTCNATMKNAIDTARALGAVVVVAAGNSGTDAQYATPANCAAAVTVAATESNGLLAGFSNYGSLVDISAPGVSIRSTINAGATVPTADNAYANYNGTSMATPHVAGVLALMFSKNSSLTPSLAESKLILGTRAFGPYFNTARLGGSGIVDAFKIVSALTSTTPVPPTTPDPSEPTPTEPTPTVPKKGIAKSRDFNGDSIADALWRNLNTGVTRLSLISASSMTLADIKTTLLNGKTYQLQASGDFNGDGNKDLILRHTANGRAIVTLMEGPTILAQGVIATVPVNFVAVGSGDFNNDGFEDILWRNAAGKSFISYMNGIQESSRSSVFSIATNLVLQGVADYDGDGVADLLLRAPSGYVYVLLMSTTGAYLMPVAIASNNYQIVGVGDYTGDSKNDILFRNSYSSLITIFSNPISVNHELLTSSNGVAAKQVIQKSGDFDGDGKADLLLRHSTTGVITKAKLVINSGYLSLEYSAPLGTVPLTFAAQ